MKVNVFIGLMPFKRAQDPAVQDWLVQTVLKIKADERVGEFGWQNFDDTPADMVRNQIVEAAKSRKADYLVMVDNDMWPDDPEANAKPFWDTTFPFMLAHHGPCVVGAPYCGPPPHCNPYAFRVSNRMNPGHTPRLQGSLDLMSREEAVMWSGIAPVPVLPTGLIVIDMRAFRHLKPPYFYYEWTDETHSKKASTEDVTFTRDCTLAGVKCYCNWDSWAGHWKWYKVPKPEALTIESLRKQYVEAVKEGIHVNEKIVHVNAGQPSQGAVPRVRIERPKMSDSPSQVTEALCSPGGIRWEGMNGIRGEHMAGRTPGLPGPTGD